MPEWEDVTVKLYSIIFEQEASIVRMTHCTVFLQEPGVTWDLESAGADVTDLLLSPLLLLGRLFTTTGTMIHISIISIIPTTMLIIIIFFYKYTERAHTIHSVNIIIMEMEMLYNNDNRTDIYVIIFLMLVTWHANNKISCLIVLQIMPRSLDCFEGISKWSTTYWSCPILCSLDVWEHNS